MEVNLVVRKGRPEDDPGIRRVLAGTPMPGPLRISYRRDPSFFSALKVEGNHSDVVVGLDEGKDRLAGFASRSIKEVFINGFRRPVGYLSNLRIEEEYRGGLTLYRGYRMMRQIHRDGRTPLYLTTILEKNKSAIDLLTSQRGCLPAYHDIGQFYCAAIGTKKSSSPALSGTMEVRRARPDEMSSVFHFLNREGPTKQFFPVYEEKDIRSPEGLLKGIEPENIIIALDGSNLCGCVGLWDQRSYKQAVVDGYAFPLNLLRLPVSTAIRHLGFPPLPAIGRVVDLRYLSMICIRKNDRHVFQALLSFVLNHSKRQFPFFMVGFHEKDPLLEVVKRHRHLSYTSRIYVACWPDGEKDYKQLDDRVPYLELGSL